MKLKSLPLIALGTAVVISTFAFTPRRLSDTLRPAIPAKETQKMAPPRTPRHLTIVEKDDTLYCTTTFNILNRHMPHDTVSPEEAKTLPFVVRLTNKNKRGYFGRLEVFKRGLVPGTYDANTTLSNFVPDSLIAPGYRALKISRIDFIYDSEGEYVVEERAYDINNNLLVSTIYNKFDLQDGIGFDELSFTPQGLPLILAKDSASMEELRVFSTYPDSTTKISFLHHNFHQTEMRDGSFYVQTIIDLQNKRHTSISLDQNNRPRISKDGYAGFINYYSPKGLQDSTVYIDPSGKPMIVIADSCNAIYGGISKRTFKFNKNRQAYEQKCYGLHNQPASVKNGAHRILYEYDKHGNVHDVKAYGVDGRPAKIDGQFSSHQTVRYDSSGNMVEFHQYDENGRPVSVGTEVSSYFREYDSNGNLINSTEYSSTPDGGEEVSYRLISKSDSSFHYFSDGSIKTLAYDKRGRMVLYKLTEADNKLSHDVDHPYSTYEYTDRPDGSVVTVEKEYLPSGTLKQIYVTDSLNLVREWYELDSLGRMTDGNRQKFDESWANVLWQENINLQGKVVRRSSSSAPLSYRVEIEKTISGDYINFHGVDEFGEDDYMCFNGMVPGVYNLHNVTHNAGFSPLTDDFKEVKTSTKNSVSKYMTIEVVDSAAYALGIRDNDIILQYGESFMADPMNSLWRFLGEWSMGEILETPHEKVMRVFRIDSVKPERCSIRDIRLPAGTSRELGFLAHLCYRTKKQDERVKKTMSDAEFSIDINPSGKLPIHVVFPDMSMQYRYQAYGEKVGVPSIVLKAEVLEIPGLKWKIGDDFFLLENIKEAVDEDGSLTLLFHYFDGNKIRTEVYSPEADRSNLYLTGAPIGEDGYESFKKMAAVLKDTPAKELTDTLKFKVADALWNNNLKNEAVKIYESMPYDQVRQNSPRLYSYYKNQPKKKKMAKFYRDVAINELSGRKEPTVHDIESLANIYAEKDSVKAAEYIANSIRDYDAGLKNQLDVYDDVAYLLKAIAAYQHAAPYEYASARLYAAFRFVFMGGNKEYIFNNYLKPLYESRQLMRPDCNGWALYGLLLRELSQQDDRYASAYLKYKRNTVHYFTPTDDGAASQKGMSGRYKLLKINDWNLADGVTWHEISEQALDIPKQVVFMDEAGNIIEQDFDGRMGGIISLEGPAE